MVVETGTHGSVPVGGSGTEDKSFGEQDHGAHDGDYPFLLIMHVAVFTFCGLAGLASVHKNFESVRNAVAVERPPRLANHLLKVWMLLYMFVGTQMAFNLAPFINRSGPVTIVNTLDGNFYSYMWDVISGSLR